jgi:hypothetical protein
MFARYHYHPMRRLRALLPCPIQRQELHRICNRPSCNLLVLADSSLTDLHPGCLSLGSLMALYYGARWSLHRSSWSCVVSIRRMLAGGPVCAVD